MPTRLKYMPTFRARQQEMLVLSSFDFKQRMYPLIEIVKEHDRKRDIGSQKSFQEIYSELIEKIKAEKVFVDLPVYLKESGSMQDEVIAFSRGVISNKEKRVDYLLKLEKVKDKIIPVVSSLLLKTGEANTIIEQTNTLRKIFKSIAFRTFVTSFEMDWAEITQVATAADYIILDLDMIAPYPTSPILRAKIVPIFNEFNTCPKIILRSAINTDIQNVSLDHGNVIYEADNSLLDTFSGFHTNAFGDYSGIKKDDLTAGGTISPGFIYFDATENQYYGFKANIKSLSEFEETIIPAVIECAATTRMLASGRQYLVPQNWGWNTIQKINAGVESGKSQAKFKRIAMEHYLHCLRTNIQEGDYD